MELAEQVYQIAEKAGLAIKQGVDRGIDQIEQSRKIDNSVITNLDILANNIIIEGLSALSEYPILSEEQNPADDETRSHWQTYWCVDPLDGTRDLIEGTGDYTVNIALIDNHKPVLGVVYIPEQKIGFLGINGAEGSVAYKIERQDSQLHRTQIHTRVRNDAQWVMAMSRFHAGSELAEKMASLPGVSIKRLGSSLKICQIAAGEIDCYPRLGPTHDWDLAAAQVILEAAGGGLFDLKFNPLMYNNKETLIQPSFLAVGDIHADWDAVIRLAASGVSCG